jgi:hypothetical protein
VPDRDASTGGLARLPDDDAITLAEGSMTVWANTLTLMATHLCEHGMPRSEVLEMLTMLHDTNEATIRSPRAKASAASHLMAVFKAFETT